MTNWKLENEIERILYQNSTDNEHVEIVVKDVWKLRDKLYTFIVGLLEKQNEIYEGGPDEPEEVTKHLDDILNEIIK